MISLKDIFKKYGKATTTNFQLLKWGKELGIKDFNVVMRNEIGNGNCKNIICNLHTSEQKGIHWSCYHRKAQTIIFFDSYGYKPTPEIIKKYPNHKIEQSYYKMQKDNETFCGQLCLYILANIDKMDYYDLLFELNKELTS